MGNRGSVPIMTLIVFDTQNITNRLPHLTQISPLNIPFLATHQNRLSRALTPKSPPLPGQNPIAPRRALPPRGHLMCAINSRKG